MSDVLLERYKKKSFLHRIVTGEEKLIHCNLKHKKTYVIPVQPAKSTAKLNIHDAKVMLPIWWDQNGVLYYELLNPYVERYRQHARNLRLGRGYNFPL